MKATQQHGRTGDGSSIPIWHSPWVRNEVNPIIVPPTIQYATTATVSHLIDPQNGSWNETLIKNNFNLNDVDEILKIPLLRCEQNDAVIWRFHKKGIYLVKSAYQVCVDMLINRDDWKVEGDWNKLWSLLIPPKVKHFMCHLGRDCLLNRQKNQLCNLPILVRVQLAFVSCLCG